MWVVISYKRDFLFANLFWKRKVIVICIFILKGFYLCILMISFFLLF
ncbi:unnamed protein product [Phytomonas sp. EM1]|nr:unnamed protein product [Phytomonas sp. EM1]|eukprot:CCW61054.1 unnamed protein product [Phytomonas sp. isolate EM1]